MSSNFIDLSEAEPVGQGMEQLVFQHPTEPDRLVKVLKPSSKRHRFRRPGVKRFKVMRIWQREMSEYVAALAHCGGHCDRLARQYGFCDTSMGPGMVMERITGPNGELAPTLRTVLMREQNSIELFRALVSDTDKLFDTLQEARVDWEDLTGSNIVVAGAEKPHLVIVDGLGSPALIPTTHMSDKIFSLANERRRRRLKALIEGAIAKRQNSDQEARP